MARPKKRPLGIRIRIDATDVIHELVRATAAACAAGRWPGRPCPSDQMFDEVLDRICTLYRIPHAMRGTDPRAILEHEFVHAEEDIRVERQSPKREDLHKQIKAIAEAAVGEPMPSDLYDDVYSRLSFMAVKDRRCGNGDWSRLAEIEEDLRGLDFVTELVRDWAAWIIVFGGTSPRSRRNHGGRHIEAELVFVSVLINYWIDVLRRAPKTWVFEDEGDKNAEFTHFVRDCLRAVGVRARTSARDGRPARKRNLNLSDAHQRILRVKEEMRKAASAGLQRNYLAQQLHKTRVSPPERT